MQTVNVVFIVMSIKSSVLIAVTTEKSNSYVVLLDMWGGGQRIIWLHFYVIRNFNLLDTTEMGSSVVSNHEINQYIYRVT